MATKKVCPHTITLFNYMGEDESGRASYSQTLIKHVHYRDGLAVASLHTPADSVRLHVFDDTAYTSKPYMDYDDWKTLSMQEKQVRWTLPPPAQDGGSDYFGLGDLRTGDTSLPTQHPLFRITKSARCQIGRRRMWHWRIDAR